MPTSVDDLVPNANSPQLLTQLLELVARGVRSSRGLQDALAVDARTVRYYLRAGEWLGLLSPGVEASLSPLGLEYVYAGRRRAEVYASAVWAVPLVRDLMSPQGELPEAEDVARAILTAHPDLAPSTARRRASAVRSLIAPAIGQKRAQSRRVPQLSLPLVPTVRTLAPPNVPDFAGERDPTLYRYLLGALQEHGELSLGHFRGLLDRAGASDAPVGGYVAMATERGDATRVDDRLVLSSEAARMADLSESTSSVILSDPGYRAWLDDLKRGDGPAEARRRQRAHLYAAWDHRLFGERPTAETLDALLGQRLIDRSLDAWPVRGATGDPVVLDKQPFLELWQRPGLLVALPPSLGLLRGGLKAVNTMLANARHGQRVGLPLPAEPVVAVHAGLLYPGERPPRAVADLRSLRMRLLFRSPYPALVTALLFAHRANPQIELRRTQAGWCVCVGRRVVATLLDLLDEFAVSRRWVVARRPRAGLTEQDLLDALKQLRIVMQLDRRAVLDEGFFVALRGEPEEMELRDLLQPLGDHLLQFLGERTA